jgi:hypothetical protein
VIAYIENVKMPAIPMSRPCPKSEPLPGTPEYQKYINEEGYRLARAMWLKRRLKAIAKG